MLCKSLLGKKFHTDFIVEQNVGNVFFHLKSSDNMRKCLFDPFAGSLKKVHLWNPDLDSHFVCAGNLAETAVCEVCEEDAGSGPGLHDFQCCWCQRTVHTACLISIGEVLSSHKTFFVYHKFVEP